MESNRINQWRTSVAVLAILLGVLTQAGRAQTSAPKSGEPDRSEETGTSISGAVAGAQAASQYGGKPRTLGNAFTNPDSLIPNGGAWVRVGENQWVYFTEHAIEHMQPSIRNASINSQGIVSPQTPRPMSIVGNQVLEARGIPPSVIGNTINHGEMYQGFNVGKGASTVYYDPVNNISVRVGADGNVISVQRGPVQEVGVAPRATRIPLGRKTPPVTVRGLARTGIATAAGFLVGEAANFVGTNFGEGLGQTRVAPGVTFHDEIAGTIRSVVGDRGLLAVDKGAGFISDTVTQITKPLKPAQDGLASAIRATVGDKALIILDDGVTTAGERIQGAGRAAGTAVVDTGTAVGQIMEENGGGVGGYLKGLLNFYFGKPAPTTRKR